MFHVKQGECLLLIGGCEQQFYPERIVTHNRGMGAALAQRGGTDPPPTLESRRK